MKALYPNLIYGVEMKQLSEQNGLDDQFEAVVTKCTDMCQIFKLLNENEADHVAVLNDNREPISNMFQYIKERLISHKEVAVALFFKKEEHSFM